MPAQQAAPVRTVAYYNRLIIWAALLFITLGLFFQNLSINIFSQQTLDDEYAQAMAAQIATGLTLKLEESQNQLKNAAQHPQTLSYLNTPQASWKRTLKTLLNGAEKVHIVDRTTARTTNRLGKAIKSIALAALQDKPAPLRATGGNTQSYFAAAPIKDSWGDIQGVLLVKYGANWIAQLKQGASPKQGHVELIQVLANTPTSIFSAGPKPQDIQALSSIAVSDEWFLTYTPTEKRPQLSTAPMALAWVLALVGTLGCLGWFAWLQNKGIRENQLLLLTYVRNLFRNQKDQRPEFTIRLFHELADAMAELGKSRGLRIEQAAEEKPAIIKATKDKQSTPKQSEHNYEYSQSVPQIDVEEVDKKSN